jgi:hypothetical protein
MSYQLMRTWYKTDTNDNDPEYIGAFSDSIPDRAVEEQTIIDVDWSVTGEVQVTFLVRRS